MTLILASTIMLLRERKQCEVFLAVRNRNVSFVPGTLVFPGGKVDPSDSDAGLRPLCDGALELDDLQFALRVAAIREAFEEAGVLFVRAEGESRLISGERAASLQHYRTTLEAGSLSWLELLQRERLRLACDLLLPYARWITPKPMPRRYDTYFFLAKTPADHVAEHDGSELVDSIWLPPAQAIKQAEAGVYSMIFPTRSNLRRLAKATNIAQACSQAQQHQVVPITPWIDTNDEGAMVLCIPRGVGYDVCEELVEGNV